jgi:hypothetical protein
MAKKKKPRPTSLNTGFSEGQKSRPCKTPRLDPLERRLSRFYEPLVLLYTLGSTRGEHTYATLSSKQSISYLPLKDVRRRFLNELAYMCDYDKGGDTVTAIGLESTPQRYVFWVASNSCPKGKIVPFLESLLIALRRTSATTEDIAVQCISFAATRVKKYRSHLNPLLRRCLEWLVRTKRDDGMSIQSHCLCPPKANIPHIADDLTEWLRSWELQRTPIALCRFAYENRKSDCMRTLARLGTEPVYKSNKEAIHNAFRLVRHYIGRLGHHFRAADALLSCSSRLPELFDDFKVCGISTPPKSTLPPADGMTKLDSIIVRMLPAKSPDLGRYQQALTEMDTKYQLSRRFLGNYTDANLKPRVHAEIQVLEHFYASALSFAGADPFIACSKPACFCCLLYIRNHPGNFVEPESHRKIYLNWRPPDTNAEYDFPSHEHQRDILNAMIQEIRKETLRQIDEKSAPRAWHPDSLTGITVSALHEQEQQTLKEAGEVASSSGDLVFIGKESHTSERLPKTTGLAFCSLTSLAVGEVSFNSARRSEHNAPPRNTQPFFDSFEEDSEEGGVLL